MEYIQQPNSIILAVSAGNVDIANSDAMKYAKMVDPQQERTIMVVTKLDLATDDLANLLSGKTLPIKLGIVGVINRSQKDINDGLSYAEILKKESGYLAEKYKRIAQNHGTPFLRLRLNNLLLQHIKKCLPSLDVSTTRFIPTFWWL